MTRNKQFRWRGTLGNEVIVPLRCTIFFWLEHFEKQSCPHKLQNSPFWTGRVPLLFLNIWTKDGPALLNGDKSHQIVMISKWVTIKGKTVHQPRLRLSSEMRIKIFCSWCWHITRVGDGPHICSSCFQMKAHWVTEEKRKDGENSGLLTFIQTTELKLNAQSAGTKHVRYKHLV